MITRLSALTKKEWLVFLGCFIALLGTSTAVLFVAGMLQTKSFVHDVGQHALHDIRYKDGMWDMTVYHADPEVPGAYRLYVVASNGFVIERWRPVPGYVDTSDAKYLLAYQTPQTVHTITGEDWRLYAQPITHDDNRYGVVAAASSSPTEDRLAAIDLRLQQTVAAIRARLSVGKDGVVQAGGVDERAIPYDLSIQVVDQYNRIVIKNNNASSLGGIPNYVDPSYVQTELKRQTTKLFVDNKNGEHFMASSWPVYDKNHAVVGTVIVAKTISPLYQLLRQFLLWGGLVQLGILAIIAYQWPRSRRTTPEATVAPTARILTLDDIQHVSFSKKDCVLYINNQKISLMYASNQYYLCAALFGAPSKKWETDILLEKFGEGIDAYSWRKVYDAMITLNKKVALIMEPRLIVNNNKTYQLNPELRNKLRIL